MTELWGVAKALEGCTRHASVHASAVVISDEPLMERVPLYKDPKRPELITGLAMGPIEKLGLLKMDFLGLRTLTVLGQRRDAHQAGAGHRPRLRPLPLDDASTYQLLAEARTFGVFQLESAGMRDALRRLKPQRIEDIIAMVALYRPGPMDLIAEFVNGSTAGANRVRAPPDGAHLQETYGIMIYQEQVMRIASDLAGLTLGEADILRKAMGKKDRELMAQKREKFIGGCKANADRSAQGFEHLGADRQVRGLRLQQEPRRGLRPGGLSDGLPQGELSGGVHGRAAHLGNGRDGQDRQVHRGVPGHGAPRGAARRQRVGRPVHRGGRRDPLRTRGDQERGRHGDRVHPEEPARSPGFTSLEEFCSRADLRLVNRRVLESLIKAGAFDSLKSTRAGS